MRMRRMQQAGFRAAVRGDAVSGLGAPNLVEVEVVASLSDQVIFK